MQIHDENFQYFVLHIPYLNKTCIVVWLKKPTNNAKMNSKFSKKK